MSLNLKTDTDSFDVFLSGFENECEELSTKMLRSAGEKAKKLITAKLNKHRRVLATRYKGRPALADDVKLSVRTDKYGEKSAKVMGGRMTGTLWHIVNDGNLHSSPTHFIDNALKELDNDIDKIWNDAER